MPIGVPVTRDDLENLTKITFLETRTNPSVRDLSVTAETVINRVADENGYWPDSISANLTASQYEPVRNGKFADYEPTQAQLATMVAIIDTLGNGSDFAALRTGGTFFENPFITQDRETGLTEGMTEAQIEAVTVYRDAPRHANDEEIHVVYSNALNDWKFDRTSQPIPDWAPLYSGFDQELASLRAHPAYAAARNELINEYSQVHGLATDQPEFAQQPEATQTDIAYEEAAVYQEDMAYNHVIETTQDAIGTDLSRLDNALTGIREVFASLDINAALDMSDAETVVSNALDAKEPSDLQLS